MSNVSGPRANAVWNHVTTRVLSLVCPTLYHQSHYIHLRLRILLSSILRGNDLMGYGRTGWSAAAHTVRSTRRRRARWGVCRQWSSETQMLCWQLQHTRCWTGCEPSSALAHLAEHIHRSILLLSEDPLSSLSHAYIRDHCYVTCTSITPWTVRNALWSKLQLLPKLAGMWGGAKQIVLAAQNKRSKI